MVSVSHIYLYGYSGLPECDIGVLVEFLKKVYPKANIEKREEFFSYQKEKDSFFNIDNLAVKLTLCRVHNVNEQTKEFTSLPMEVAYEKKRLQTQKELKGIVYDGCKLQNVYQQLIKKQEFNLSILHLIFTNQLIASFDQNDKRYHLRTGIYGLPNIISASGLIEALAKPREYYLKQQLGEDSLTLKQEFKGQIIDYQDTRIAQLLKGYCLQALFYQIEGRAFCEDKNCCLYNAHWQQEAIRIQIESANQLCPKHLETISKWRKS